LDDKIKEEQNFSFETGTSEVDRNKNDFGLNRMKKKKLDNNLCCM